MMLKEWKNLMDENSYADNDNFILFNKRFDGCDWIVKCRQF
jgi:hypothetical protein